jgi:hypothetical protein
VVFEDNGVKVLVDPKVHGQAQLDFVREGYNEGLQVHQLTSVTAAVAVSPSRSSIQRFFAVCGRYLPKPPRCLCWRLLIS